METCSDCPDTATCEYDLGTGRRLACGNHDPFRMPLAVATGTVGWYYRSLPKFPVLATTGHLGIAGGYLA